jgi:hypothetical protein
MLRYKDTVEYPAKQTSLYLTTEGLIMKLRDLATWGSITLGAAGAAFAIKSFLLNGKLGLKGGVA